jgi:hypothetical protein
MFKAAVSVQCVGASPREDRDCQRALV